MATTAIRPAVRQYDRIFFAVMTVMILITAVTGFAHTYYFAGMVAAPLPNLLIHVHGAAFTLWLILLATQTALVSARRVDLHRKLGMGGMFLAMAMVCLGLAAAVDSLRHRALAVPGLSATTFFVVPVTDIILFSILIGSSYRLRRDTAAHKRLVILGSVAILDAAIARMRFVSTHWEADVLLYLFLVAMIAYDLFSRRSVHRVTVWGSAMIVVVQQIRIPLAMTPPWQAFATFVQGHH